MPFLTWRRKSAPEITEKQQNVVEERTTEEVERPTIEASDQNLTPTADSHQNVVCEQEFIEYETVAASKANSTPEESCESQTKNRASESPDVPKALKGFSSLRGRRRASFSPSKFSSLRSRSSSPFGVDATPRTFLESLANALRAPTALFYKDIKEKKEDRETGNLAGQQMRKETKSKSPKPARSVTFRSQNSYIEDTSRSSPVEVPKKPAPGLPTIDLSTAPFLEPLDLDIPSPGVTARPTSPSYLRKLVEENTAPSQAGTLKTSNARQDSQSLGPQTSNLHPVPTVPVESPFRDGDRNKTTAGTGCNKNIEIGDQDFQNPIQLSKVPFQEFCNRNPAVVNPKLRAAAIPGIQSKEKTTASEPEQHVKPGVLLAGSSSLPKTTDSQALVTQSAPDAKSEFEATNPISAAICNAKREIESKPDDSINKQLPEIAGSDEPPHDVLTNVVTTPMAGIPVENVGDKSKVPDDGSDGLPPLHDSSNYQVPRYSSTVLHRKQSSLSDNCSTRSTSSANEGFSPIGLDDILDSEFQKSARRIISAQKTPTKNIDCHDKPLKPIGKIVHIPESNPVADPIKSTPDSNQAKHRSSCEISVHSTPSARTRRPFRYTNRTDESPHVASSYELDDSWRARTLVEEEQFKNKHTTPSPTGIPLPSTVNAKFRKRDSAEQASPWKHVFEGGWTPFSEPAFVEVAGRANEVSPEAFRILLTQESGLSKFWQEAELPEETGPPSTTKALSQEDGQAMIRAITQRYQSLGCSSANIALTALPCPDTPAGSTGLVKVPDATCEGTSPPVLFNNSHPIANTLTRLKDGQEATEEGSKHTQQTSEPILSGKLTQHIIRNIGCSDNDAQHSTTSFSKNPLNQRLGPVLNRSPDSENRDSNVISQSSRRRRGMTTPFQVYRNTSSGFSDSVPSLETDVAFGSEDEYSGHGLM